MGNLFSQLISKVFAQDGIGKLKPPTGMGEGIDASGNFTGITVFFNSLLRLAFIVAGIWAFINFIIAGYGFMSAGGESKNISKAWDRIWQSFMGLLFVVGSFLLAAIAGILIFHKWDAILNPTLNATTK